jgi:hypothetical protein
MKWKYTVLLSPNLIHRTDARCCHFFSMSDERSRICTFSLMRVLISIALRSLFSSTLSRVCMSHLEIVTCDAWPLNFVWAHFSNLTRSILSLVVIFLCYLSACLTSSILVGRDIFANVSLSGAWSDVVFR